MNQVPLNLQIFNLLKFRYVKFVAVYSQHDGDEIRVEMTGTDFGMSATCGHHVPELS